MTRRTLCIGLVALALLAVPATGRAQPVSPSERSIRGTVVRADDGTAVEGAVVDIAGTTLRVTTGRNGEFVFRRAPVGAVRVRVAAIGFEPKVEPLPGAESGDVPVLRVALVPTTVRLAPVVVTAARRTQLAGETSTSVSVATTRDVERRATVGVDEAVDRIPGVQILDGQINIRGSSGYAKGLGSRVLMLVDGVPATQADRGGINWDLVPITEVERVEVLKGTGSALYGSAALGGVVNVITAPIPEEPAMRVRLLAGTYADPPYAVWRWRSSRALFFGLDVAASRRMGPIRARAAAGAFTSGGYRENNDDNRYRASLKLTYEPNPSFRADMSASAVREDYGTVVTWCVRYTCEDRGQAYQPFRADSAARGYRTVSDKYFVHATARRIVSPRLALRTRASWYRTHFLDTFHADSDASTSDRLGVELIGEWHPTATRTLLVGSEASRSFVASPPLGTDTVGIFGDHTQTELAWYAESEAPLARGVTASIGMRIDAYAVDDRAWSAVASPRFGARWQLPGLRLRASLGRGFRAPALAERFVSTVALGLRVIANPTLETETSWGGEIGASVPVARSLLLDAAVFWSDYDRLIEPGLDTSGARIQFRNVTDARVRGVDLALAAGLWRGRLEGTLAYTYLDARDLSLDLPLVFRPKHVATLGADVTLGAITAGLDARISSAPERVDLYENDRRVAARTVDLRATWRYGAYEVAAKVRNVLNYTYTLVPRTLEPPRTLSVAVTVRR